MFFKFRKLPCLLLALVPFVSAPATVAAQPPGSNTTAIIKLYSGGKLVATYYSIDPGSKKGDCFVFHVSKGGQNTEVMVCGSFSVEFLH